VTPRAASRYVSFSPLLLAVLLACGSYGHCLKADPNGPRLAYFFRQEACAGAHCDSCSQRYWCFECKGDDCRYLGEWNPGTDIVEPAWVGFLRDAEKMANPRNYGKPFGCLWPTCSDPTQTPRANEEAEQTALWLSGSLVAPESLYRLVLGQLTAIRAVYADTVPEVATIHFFPWVFTYHLSVRLRDEAFKRFQSGTYHDLDELNARYGLSEVEFSGVEPEIWLTFTGHYNTVLLADIYGHVPSVAHAYTWFNAKGRCWGTEVLPWVLE